MTFGTKTVNGKTVPSSAEDVAKIIGGLKPGEKIELQIIRKSKKETLGEKKDF